MKKSTNTLALIAGVTMAVALLSSGLGIANWQFWLAGVSTALAFLAGQAHGRTTRYIDRTKRVPTNWPWS